MKFQRWGLKTVCFNLSVKYIIFFPFLQNKSLITAILKKSKKWCGIPPNHGIINQLGVSFGLYEYSCSTCWHVTGHCGQRLAPLKDRVELEVLELLSVLILLSLFRTYREIMAHSFLVLLVCTSPSCDNSICSVSSSMNYGWTPQPLSVVGIYVDQAAFCSVTPPFCVKGSVWIWKRSEREKKNQGNLQRIKAEYPVNMPLLPRWQTSDWLLGAETH